jgi:hypothetical protein
MTSPSDNGRFTIDVGLDLLDRQIQDKDGLLAGKVDDLELSPPGQGDGPPVLAAILAGPGALAPRLGRVATWIAERRLRLGPREEPSRISFGVVARAGTSIHLAVSRDELDSVTSERWASRIVQRIPGAS